VDQFDRIAEVSKVQAEIVADAVRVDTDGCEPLLIWREELSDRAARILAAPVALRED
jgi:hypothetical protein